MRAASSGNEVLALGIGEQPVAAGRYDLVEGFRSTNHAQVGARAFFSGSAPVLQIEDFRLERAIAIAKRIVLRPAARRQPASGRWS